MQLLYLKKINFNRYKKTTRDHFLLAQKAEKSLKIINLKIGKFLAFQQKGQFLFKKIFPQTNNQRKFKKFKIEIFFQTAFSYC